MHGRRETYLRAGLSGLLSVGAGLAVGELVAALVTSFASPYRAVAAFVVDQAPAFARDFAIDTFGTADKPALLVGMGVILALIAIGAGILQVRRPPLGLVVVGLFAGFGVLAAMTRPTADARYLLPSLVAGLVAAGVLVVLCRGIAARRRDGDGSEGAASAGAASEGAAPGPAGSEGAAPGPAASRRPVAAGWSRRQFVAAVGLVAAGSAATYVVARRIAATGGALAERAGLRLPGVSSAAAPIPAGTDLDVDGVTPFVTANPDFYRIDTALQVPQLSTADWRLRIHGMVDREITLTWDDLMAMPAMERIITLTCVSNEVGGDLADNARWLGYGMREILERAGPQADADMLLSTSVDGWTSGTPLSAVTDGRDAMLAIGMNGEPLPFEHGYPVRQVIPGLYGFVSACKWVIDWEVTRFDRAQAYWTQRGWGVQAPIKTASRIDRPAPLSTSPAGPVVVAGTAWAQHRGIRSVEVRVDDGPWQQAELATEYSTDTWRQWRWTWDAAPGQYTLYCRATDNTGETQPEQRVAPIPDGATGWHSRVVRIG